MCAASLAIPLNGHRDEAPEQRCPPEAVLSMTDVVLRVLPVTTTGGVWQLNSRVTGPTVHIRYSMDAWNCGRPPNRYPEVAAGCGALPARTGRQSAQGRRRVGTRRTARYVQSWSILRPPVSSCLDRHRAVWRQHVYTLQSPISTPVGPGHATSRTPCSPAAGVAGGRRRRSCWGRASV